MDLRQLSNILTISEERSITRAAEKLFITQSALNQQLQKLEAELGTPLFTRTRSDWRPTPAGEIYLQAVREILSIKKDAYNRIQDMTSSARRHFTVGLIPERGVNMFTAIYPQFHRQFPQVTAEPVECDVRAMQKLIQAGEVDLGLITLTETQKDENIYLHMADEEILLAVPASHPLADRAGAVPETAPLIPLEHFSGDPFIRIFRRSTMHALEDRLFAEAGFAPQVLFSTSSNISKYRMVASGVGLALLPRVFAAPADAVRYFRLPGSPRWEVTMCHRRGAYLSGAEQTFLDLCRGYWKQKLPAVPDGNDAEVRNSSDSQ